MKILIAFLLALFAGALFLPSADHSGIRNLPLLIAVLSLVVLIFLIRVCKYVILMIKAKRILKKKGFRCVKFVAFPFGSMLRGRYSMTFQNETEELNVLLLVRKKQYPHYYVRDLEHLEFYRSNRVVFKGSKVSATVTNLVETKLVGKQKIKWNSNATNSHRNILLFDNLPYKVTDSMKASELLKKPELGNGDRICSSDTYLYDLKGLESAVDI